MISPAFLLKLFVIVSELNDPFTIAGDMNLTLAPHRRQIFHSATRYSMGYLDNKIKLC